MMAPHGKAIPTKLKLVAQTVWLQATRTPPSTLKRLLDLSLPYHVTVQRYRRGIGSRPRHAEIRPLLRNPRNSSKVPSSGRESFTYIFKHEAFEKGYSGIADEYYQLLGN
jgi:hypothetical protein